MHAISYVCIHIPCAPPPQPCRDYIFGWSRRARRGCPSFVLSSRLVTYSSARLTACTTGTCNIAVGSGWGHCLPCPALLSSAGVCIGELDGTPSRSDGRCRVMDGWLAGWLSGHRAVFRSSSFKLLLTTICYIRSCPGRRFGVDRNNVQTLLGGSRARRGCRLRLVVHLLTLIGTTKRAIAAIHTAQKTTEPNSHY